MLRSERYIIHAGAYDWVISLVRTGYTLNTGMSISPVLQLIYRLAMPVIAARSLPSDSASRRATRRPSNDPTATLLQEEPHSSGSSCPGSDDEDGEASSQGDTERNTRPTEKTGTTDKSEFIKTFASEVARYEQLLKAGLTWQPGGWSSLGAPSAVVSSGGSGSDATLTFAQDSHYQAAGDIETLSTTTAGDVKAQAEPQSESPKSPTLHEPSIELFFCLTDADVAEEEVVTGASNKSGYH